MYYFKFVYNFKLLCQIFLARSFYLSEDGRRLTIGSLYYDRRVYFCKKPRQKNGHKRNSLLSLAKSFVCCPDRISFSNNTTDDNKYFLLSIVGLTGLMLRLAAKSLLIPIFSQIYTLLFFVLLILMLNSPACIGIYATSDYHGKFFYTSFNFNKFEEAVYSQYRYTRKSSAV